MEILCISLCVFALFACSFGENDPLEVYFENATRVDTVEGATSIHFRCHLNRGAMYVINNNVDIVHVNPITKEETIMSSAADLVEGKPSNYDVQINQNPDDLNSMVLDFTISTVRQWDDGIYRCHVHPGPKSSLNEEGMADREIIVHRPVSSLKLMLGDFDPIEDSPKDALKIDPGEYKVACIAEGSNPATEDVHLYFHGVMLEHAKPVITQMEGNERIFTTKVNGTLNILVSHSEEALACQSTDSTGQSKSVELKFDVNIYDPVVHCNHTEAYLGEENPVLYCTVNHTDLEVEGYSFQIGDTGEIVKEGDKHPKNIVVTVSNVSPGVSVVSLDLHKAEQQYLDKNYYILIDMKGGHTSKHTVELHKIDPPVSERGNSNGNSEGQNGNGLDGGSGHGVRLAPSAVLYVLFCVAAFWSSH